VARQGGAKHKVKKNSTEDIMGLLRKRRRISKGGALMGGIGAVPHECREGKKIVEYSRLKKKREVLAL